jgi:hypothetical protein
MSLASAAEGLGRDVNLAVRGFARHPLFASSVDPAAVRGAE